MAVTRIAYNRIVHVFKDLFTQLNKIDPQAVNYLKSVLANGRCRYGFKYYTENENARNIDSLLLWSNTPQGHEYWRKLHVTLNPNAASRFRSRGI